MRSPRTTVLAAIAAALFLVTADAARAAGATLRDATRDVYVDGRLDRATQVLVRSGPYGTIVVSPQLEEALLLDRDSESFRAVPREAIAFAEDRATAQLAVDAATLPGGATQKVDASTTILNWKGHTVLLARHQGVSGEIDAATLFATVPIWKSLKDHYAPDASAVAALRKAGKARLTVVFGTWCGDSKEYVPRLLKTVEAAANPDLTVRLVALDPGFLRPADVIQGRRVINVPTILVDRGGKEIGRVTETPAVENVEQDVAAILSGRPNPHAGRYERGAEIARGSYRYADESGADRGTERWTIWERPKGGRLVHAVIEREGTQIEVFQGSDTDGKMSFAEVTRRQGEGVMRARWSLDGGMLTGRLRGRESGILQQELVVGSDFAFASPAIAAAGWMAAATPGGSGTGAVEQVVCYVAPDTFESPLGTTCVVLFRPAGEERAVVPAGEFATTRLARQSGVEFSDWWMHKELGIPVRGRVAGGLEYELTRLDLPPAGQREATPPREGGGL
ncbi:MAG TPA: thioredoxin family protein [Thermoanaerobaculia bacterium]